MYRLLLALVATVLFPASVSGAACLPTEAMEKLIENKFNQEMVVVGKVEDDRLFRLYASADSREWTIVVFLPTEKACAVLAGTHLDIVPPKKEEHGISLSPEEKELLRKLLLGRDA